MRPETVRRLLVLGVCAGGVGALYLLPSVSGTPTRPADVTRPDQTRPDQTRPDSTGGREAGGPAGDPDPVSAEPVAEVPTGASRLQPAEPTRTTRHTASRGDVRSPTVVTALQTEATRDRLTVRWSAAEDDVAVAAYVVELNGYAVAETSDVSVTIPWFKGPERQQVVRVAARDAAGNVGEPAARLVERPDATSTEEPTASPAPGHGDPSEPAPGRSGPSAEAPEREAPGGEPSGAAEGDRDPGDPTPSAASGPSTDAAQSAPPSAPAASR